MVPSPLLYSYPSPPPPPPFLMSCGHHRHPGPSPSASYRTDAWKRHHSTVPSQSYPSFSSSAFPADALWPDRRPAMEVKRQEECPCETTVTVFYYPRTRRELKGEEATPNEEGSGGSLSTHPQKMNLETKKYFDDDLPPPPPSPLPLPGGLSLQEGILLGDRWSGFTTGHRMLCAALLGAPYFDTAVDSTLSVSDPHGKEEEEETQNKTKHFKIENAEITKKGNEEEKVGDRLDRNGGEATNTMIEHHPPRSEMREEIPSHHVENTAAYHKDETHSPFMEQRTACVASTSPCLTSGMAREASVPPQEEDGEGQTVAMTLDNRKAMGACGTPIPPLDSGTSTSPSHDRIPELSGKVTTSSSTAGHSGLPTCSASDEKTDLSLSSSLPPTTTTASSLSKRERPARALHPIRQLPPLLLPDAENVASASSSTLLSAPLASSFPLLMATRRYTNPVCLTLPIWEDTTLWEISYTTLQRLIPFLHQAFHKSRWESLQQEKALMSSTRNKRYSISISKEVEKNRGVPEEKKLWVAFHRFGQKHKDEEENAKKEEEKQTEEVKESPGNTSEDGNDIKPASSITETEQEDDAEKEAELVYEQKHLARYALHWWAGALCPVTARPRFHFLGTVVCERVSSDHPLVVPVQTKMNGEHYERRGGWRGSRGRRGGPAERAGDGAFDMNRMCANALETAVVRIPLYPGRGSPLFVFPERVQ